MLTVRGKIAFWFVDHFVPAVFPRVNPAARWLLKSRLHGVMSWYVVVLCFSGRRTGKLYEVPIAYHRSSDGTLEAVTSTKGVWWRNLRGVLEISVVHKGELRQAKVELIVDDAETITRALQSRDACRRLLVPASIGQTVLLRIHLLPIAGAADPPS